MLMAIPWWGSTDSISDGVLAAALVAGQWDLNKMEHFLPVYEAAFGDRDRPVRVLEIGVNLGGSLQLWRTYFTHPDTVIVGIDAESACAQFADQDHGIHVRIGRQQDEDFLQGVLAEFGPFDIIIDDGSHIPSFTLTSFRRLFLSGLRDHGVYLVEDLHPCYHPQACEPFPDVPEFAGANDGSPTFVEVVKMLIDVMHAHYLQTPTGEEMGRWEPGNPRWNQVVIAPWATQMVSSITMHDDIVAIRRGPRPLPRMIRRWSRERMTLTRDPIGVGHFLDERYPFLGESSRTRQDWVSHAWPAQVAAADGAGRKSGDVTLTQAQYDALDPKDPEVCYWITDNTEREQ